MKKSGKITHKNKKEVTRIAETYYRHQMKGWHLDRDSIFSLMSSAKKYRLEHLEKVAIQVTKNPSRCGSGVRSTVNGFE